jgi:hypothetical protein
VNEDAATKRYQRLGRLLNSRDFSRGERKSMVAERRGLLADFGPSLRRPGSRAEASRQHFTVSKPRQREVRQSTEDQLRAAAGETTLSAGPLSTGHVMVLLLDHAGEVVYRYDLAVGNIWRGETSAMSPAGRRAVVQALQGLTGKIGRI